MLEEKLVRSSFSLRFALTQKYYEDVFFSGPENVKKVSEPISAQCCISYRNQSFDLQCKSNDWFLYRTQHWAEMGKKSSLHFWDWKKGLMVECKKVDTHLSFQDKCFTRDKVRMS